MENTSITMKDIPLTHDQFKVEANYIAEWIDTHCRELGSSIIDDVKNLDDMDRKFTMSLVDLAALQVAVNRCRELYRVPEDDFRLAVDAMSMQYAPIPFAYYQETIDELSSLIADMSQVYTHKYKGRTYVLYSDPDERSRVKRLADMGQRVMTIALSGYKLAEDEDAETDAIDTLYEMIKGSPIDNSLWAIWRSANRIDRATKISLLQSWAVHILEGIGYIATYPICYTLDDTNTVATEEFPNTSRSTVPNIFHVILASQMPGGRMLVPKEGVLVELKSASERFYLEDIEFAIHAVYSKLFDEPLDLLEVSMEKIIHWVEENWNAEK